MKHFSMGLALLGAVYGLLRFPREISGAVRESLTLCTDTLLPSLFPFFVLSALTVELGLARRLGRGLSGVMGPLFRLPGSCAAAVVLGLVGGYPTGARTAAALNQSGQCSRDEARRLLGFCCACSPAFILGAVGNGMFASPRRGLLLLATHWLGAVLTGFLLNIGVERPEQRAEAAFPPPEPTFFAAFAPSVTGSLRAVLDLFAFVLCFGAVGKLAELSGLGALPTKLLAPLLSGDNARAVLLGLLDMPRWVMGLTGGSEAERLVLSAFLLAWGGLSIHCQILSILHEARLSPAIYWKGKSLHALLSALLTAAALGYAGAAAALCGIIAVFSVSRRKIVVEKWEKLYYNSGSKQKEL